MICRILPRANADGPTNMALDEALLDSVDAEPARACLRVYGWTEPTLSLGYFQSFQAPERSARWPDAPTVRRITGGGAIWHEHELTYALVVPRSGHFAESARLYRAVHEYLRGRLQALGYGAELRGETSRVEVGQRPFLCFRDRDRHDVLVGGAKVLGSAQRRRPRAVLQHGSLLLRPSAAAPDLVGLGSFSGPPSPSDAAASDVFVGLAQTLGFEPLDDAPTARELERMRQLRENRYMSPDWTRRR